jgi:hypothetical protein
MEVEDNKECNWCGRELEDETSEFGKLGLNEFPDDEVHNSTSSVTMELDDETLTMLMKQGLQYLIDEMRMTDKVMVLTPNEFEGEASTWELSDDDRNALFHFGFIYALKMGMKEN